MTDDNLVRRAKRRAALLAWPLMLLGGAAVAGAAALGAASAVPIRPVTLALSGAVLTWGGWAFAGGWALRQLRPRWLGWAGTALALAPFVVSCVLSLPKPAFVLLGVTAALIALAAHTLRDDLVRAGFAAVARRDAERAEDEL